jgi:hypothetical protein
MPRTIELVGTEGRQRIHEFQRSAWGKREEFIRVDGSVEEAYYDADGVVHEIVRGKYCTCICMGEIERC